MGLSLQCEWIEVKDDEKSVLPAGGAGLARERLFG